MEIVRPQTSVILLDGESDYDDDTGKIYSTMSADSVRLDRESDDKDDPRKDSFFNGCTPGDIIRPQRSLILLDDDSDDDDDFSREISYDKNAAVCRNCSEIDWSGSGHVPGRAYPSQELRLEESPSQMYHSDCEICQFFGETILEHQRQSGLEHTIPKITLGFTGVWGTFYRFATCSYRLPSGYRSYKVRVECVSAPQERVRPIGNQFSDPNQVKGWVETCTKHDPYDFAASETLRHFKVIYCDDRPPRVIVAPSYCRYVTLSYVWGDPVESSYKKGDVLGDRIPQTISDRIDVTVRLGFKHLWVDRYVCRDPAYILT